MQWSTALIAPHAKIEAADGVRPQREWRKGSPTSLPVQPGATTCPSARLSRCAQQAGALSQERPFATERGQTAKERLSGRFTNGQCVRQQSTLLRAPKPLRLCTQQPGCPRLNCRYRQLSGCNPELFATERGRTPTQGPEWQVHQRAAREQQQSTLWRGPQTESGSLPMAMEP
jgi:hypothetical protein